MAQEFVTLGGIENDGVYGSDRKNFGIMNKNFTFLFNGQSDVSTKTANYTLALADAGTIVEGNSATALTFTVPPNSAVAFPINCMLDVRQVAAGQVTIAPGAGVTLRSPNGLTTRAIWTSLTLTKRATDEWIIVGDGV